MNSRSSRGRFLHEFVGLRIARLHGHLFGAFAGCVSEFVRAWISRSRTLTRQPSRAVQSTVAAARHDRTKAVPFLRPIIFSSSVTRV